MQNADLKSVKLKCKFTLRSLSFCKICRSMNIASTVRDVAANSGLGAGGEGSNWDLFKMFLHHFNDVGTSCKTKYSW